MEGPSARGRGYPLGNLTNVAPGGSLTLTEAIYREWSRVGQW